MARKRCSRCDKKLKEGEQCCCAKEEEVEEIELVEEEEEEHQQGLWVGEEGEEVKGEVKKEEDVTSDEYLSSVPPGWTVRQLQVHSWLHFTQFLSFKECSNFDNLS